MDLRLSRCTRRRLLITLAVGGVFGRRPTRALDPPAGLPGGSDSPGRDEGLAEAMEQMRQRHQVPALWGLISDERQDVLIEAVGVRESASDERATPADSIHIGSCTKAMTATLIARYVDRGLIGWDQTVRALFPAELVPTDSALAGRTLWQLLTHTAGTPANAPWASLDMGDRLAARQAVVQWTAQQPLDPPGAYRYSNTGYVIAGAILEHSAGRPWEDLLRDELWQPLGIEQAGFGPLLAPQPSGHQLEGAVPRPIRGDNPPVLGPAGTVHLPLAQWAKFARLFIDYSAAAQTILSEAAWQRLRTPAPNTEYAGGWLVVSRPNLGGTVLTHAGSNTLWFAVAWVLPDRRRLLMAATNAGGDSAQAACDAMVMELARLS